MNKRIVSLAVLTAVVGLSTAVAAASSPVTGSRMNTVRSPYASFLVGRYAMTMGDVDTAARALGAAATDDPADATLREKAFLVNILNGNIDQAARLVGPADSLSDTGKLMSGLVTATTSIKAGKGAAAAKAINAILAMDTEERSAALLQPYAQAMAGNWKAAFDESGDAAMNATDRGRLLVYLIKAERARLYEIKGRKADAEALYTSLYQPGAASFVFGPDYASFLERQGRKDEARTVWKAIADSGSDPVARLALARLDTLAYAPPALPTLTASAAQALLLSATIYSSDRDSEMSLATLRLSLYLDGSSDKARIFLGQIGQELKDTASAEAAWAGVPATSPYATEARLRRIWSLRGRGDTDQALALVEQALTQTPDEIAFVVEKADILHDQGKETEALQVLSDRAASRGEADFTWQAYFLQAMAYDAIDRWDSAEAAINKGRAIGGDRPEILNFLGYSWIARGLHVKEGMDLARQAMAVSPRSAAIVDTLGWGYYKLGDYDQALTYVEQAVQMDPSDAEINEHLGDVYKALGRDTEARYEWQRVLTLNASDKATASVKAKLDAQETATTTSVGIGKPMTTGKAAATAFNDNTQGGKKSSE